jgi:iron complex outermembrane recepter protein
MTRTMLMRGASVGALTFAILSSASQAQEALPTIEVGASQPSPARPEAAIGPAAAKPIPEDNETYRPTDATTALKTNTPIMETPASVVVVPRAVIQDLGARTVSEALAVVSGVIVQPENQSGTQYFFIRGFQTSDYYRDGVRMNTNVTGIPIPLANVDRIEVLKGPASILYGRAEPGGIVNVVTKQPLEKPYFAVQQQADSWGGLRTTLDATGPLTPDNSLLYRINMSYDNAHDFWDFSNGRDYYIAPKLRWNIDAATQVNVYFDYHQRINPFLSPGLAFTNSRDPFSINGLGVIPSALFGDTPVSFLPRSRNYGDPFSRATGREVIAGYNWSRDLNENWNLKQRFQAQTSNLFSLADFPFGYDFVNPTQLNRGAFLSRYQVHTYFANADLTGQFETLGLKHTLLVGTDFQRQNVIGYTVSNFATVPNIDLFSPTYTNFSTFSLDPTDPSTSGQQFFGSHENWWGFYLQDQIKLPYNFSVLAGARYDRATTYDVIAKDVFDASQKVSPRCGLLWRPIPELSLYGSYLENFGGSNTFGLRPLKPQTAQQWEVGAKTELFDGRVTATLAYFNLIKQNVAVPDPDPALAAQGFQVSTGEVRNKGVELDVAGEILPGWRVIGSYSYINSIITKDTTCTDPANFGPGCVFDVFGNLIGLNGNKGNQLFSVPRHSASFWTTYEFQDWNLRGLKIGGGMVARSLSQGDNQNDYHLPGFATLALMASYEVKLFDRKTTFQINVDNLLDKRFYPSSGGTTINYIVGAPRAVKGLVKVEF